MRPPAPTTAAYRTRIGWSASHLISRIACVVLLQGRKVSSVFFLPCSPRGPAELARQNQTHPSRTRSTREESCNNLNYWNRGENDSRCRGNPLSNLANRNRADGDYPAVFQRCRGKLRQPVFFRYVSSMELSYRDSLGLTLTSRATALPVIRKLQRKILKTKRKPSCITTPCISSSIKNLSAS